MKNKPQGRKAAKTIEAGPALERWQRAGDISWCPGCGNFKVLEALALALAELGLEPWQVCVVSGIGQSGKLPHYVKCNFLHGLHGRTLAQATGVKLANPELCVIAVGGDGDIYGEGGNHLVHSFRRNFDICCLVHNNGVYGLTKGQPAPTMGAGFRSRLTPAGTSLPGFNPMAAGIALGGTFVARSYCGDTAHLAGMIVAAVRHKGFGFVDVLQPCVTYNKVNTYQYYEQRVYDLAKAGHDPAHAEQAMKRALEWPEAGDEKIPVGLFYRDARPSYDELLRRARKGAGHDRPVDPKKVKKLAEEFR